jgi:hypothetical protein
LGVKVAFIDSDSSLTPTGLKNRNETPASKMNAHDVFECLQSRFVSPDWVLAKEISLVPGFSSRRADVVAINCLGSGRWACSILGIEIKVSRADFLTEIKNPNKRAETYTGTDGVFLAYPKGLVKDSEVPEDLGIITCDSGSARIKRIPKDLILPSAICEKLEPTEYGEILVRDMDRMPSIQRSLSITLIRAMNPDRYGKLTYLRHLVKESVVGLHNFNDYSFRIPNKP